VLCSATCAIAVIAVASAATTSATQKVSSYQSGAKLDPDIYEYAFRLLLTNRDNSGGLL
jgi:hypothetical protein